MKYFNNKKDILKKNIKWCIGCGNYSIIYQLGKVFEKIKINKNKIVIVSGIGCSSRLPYYINTFGIHSIHGRPFSIATGIKLSNPKLNVWVITGDSDSFSIGLNHLLHTIRNNIDINILIINNEVLSLTKGQKSVTSYNDNNNKTFNILNLILSAGSKFVARCLEFNIKHLKKILIKANKHIGTSCIEILQNCPIYNNKLNIKNKYFLKKLIFLKNKKKIIYGKKKKKLLILKNNKPKIIKYNKINELNNKKYIWIHNYKNIYKSFILSRLHRINKYKLLPLGIIYKKY
ncbi:MAG: thiamine pyrophosphate-dependent enzyme [Candidatus Shikimatogenerans sp. JK-2022]|nr:thiamine pyrophosphate-dependent enzyme [Candidatus Shikimatogenerans bostrichidophilus]